MMFRPLKTVRPTDRRYGNRGYKGFNDLTDADNTLETYCARCASEGICKVTKELRQSMGENAREEIYPFWSGQFVGIELKQEEKDRLKRENAAWAEALKNGTEDKSREETSRLPESIVACRAFEPLQREFAFMQEV